MTKRLAAFWREERGVGALEFALITPAMVLLIAGIAQLGILFMANAGLRNAVAEGARYATIYPRPSDTEIRDYITDRRFGIDPAGTTTPTITHGVADGANYIDIGMTYTLDLNFVFFTIEDISLEESRRAFVHAS